MEKYKDHSFSEKVETIDKRDIDDLLINPVNWFPCNEVIAISITEKGFAYLEIEIPKYADRINERLAEK